VRARVLAEAHAIRAAVDRATLARSDADRARAAAQRAAAVADLCVAVSEAARDAIRSRVEIIVSLILRAVIGPHASFRFEVEVKRGQVEMTPQVGYAATNKPIVWRSLADVGGGVVDLVAFGLRLSILAMSVGVRPVLIVDEPFRHVSTDRMPDLSRVVRQLSTRLGVQIVAISHEPELAGAAHRVIGVERAPDGRSVVTDQGGLP
jgi:DNA repair ATPase RecN